jgi:hypothetical protein
VKKRFQNVPFKFELHRYSTAFNRLGILAAKSQQQQQEEEEEEEDASLANLAADEAFRALLRLAKTFAEKKQFKAQSASNTTHGGAVQVESS